MIDRRGFLAALAAAFTIDPDRLLWRPGEKHFSIPKPLLTAAGFEYYTIEWPVVRRGETSFGVYVREMIAANEIFRRKLDTRYE